VQDCELGVCEVSGGHALTVVRWARDVGGAIRIVGVLEADGAVGDPRASAIVARIEAWNEAIDRRVRAVAKDGPGHRDNLP
jgi:hypothetical protein